MSSLGYKWDNEEGEVEAPSSANASLTQTLTLQYPAFAVRRDPYEKIRLQITPISDEILRISVRAKYQNCILELIKKVENKRYKKGIKIN